MVLECYFVYILGAAIIEAFSLQLSAVVLAIRSSRGNWVLFHTDGVGVFDFREMEILKAFTADSRFLSVDRIKKLQAGFTILHILGIGGLYATSFYIGHAPPAFIVYWNGIGYKIFVVFCLFYETFHGIFISNAVRVQVIRRERLFGSKGSETSSELKALYYIVLCGLIFTWLGAILWLSSAFHGPNSAALDEMDILKSFTADSKYLNPNRVKNLQIAFTILHFTCIGGLYLYGGYVGHTPPQFISSWNSIGYKIFVLTCLVYETFHAIYISRSVSRQVERRKALISTSSDTHSKLRKLYYIIVIGLCVSWVGGLLWVASAFHGPSSIALESLGNSLGYGHCLFLTMVYKYLRAANQHQQGAAKSNSKKAKDNLGDSSVMGTSEM
ncbi:hypothetical protein HDV06_006633 [Boothiomyces sp. JEL0866]|nr:hypothetical protein HDV06_006633 [Boothiomyces sp. JEL0866]